MLHDEKADTFILSLNRAIIQCCEEHKPSQIEAISAIGQIFMFASSATGMYPDTFDESLKILSDGFKQVFDGNNKND